MVVGRDPCILQLPGGFIGKLAEGDTDLHAQLFHVPHNFENGLKFRLALPDSFPSGPHAEPSSPGGLGLTRFIQNGLAVHQAFRLHPSVVS